MSIFILTNPADREKLAKRIDRALEKEETVEVIIKKPVRTDNQNRYLHLLINFFSVEYGCSADETKIRFFKQTCNPDIFEQVITTPKGEHTFLRSTASLSTEEMSLAITRFKNWSASEAGIYLPDADEQRYIAYAEQQIANQAEWMSRHTEN